MEYHYIKQNYPQWNTTDLAAEEKIQCLLFTISKTEKNQINLTAGLYCEIGLAVAWLSLDG